MEEQQSLLDDIRTGASELLGPAPLAHSLELAEGLPLVRRHVGPRAWYQCLEGSPAQVSGRANP